MKVNYLNVYGMEYHVDIKNVLIIQVLMSMIVNLN